MPRTKSHKHKYSDDIGNVEIRVSSERDRQRDDGNRYKNERYQEDADRDHRHKSWRHREDTDREKRARDIKRLKQFVPLMFGRPPMNMNNLGLPFPGHGNPGVWGNQVRESGPPPLSLHGWEPNNPGFNGSHGFANWDHMRPQLNNQLNADMPSAAQKNDHSVQGPTDEVLSGVTQTQIENEENQPVVNTLEVLKVADQVSGAWKEDAAHIAQFYLSKIDVSKDLTEPEIYDQCKSMLNSDLASVSDESDCKILFLEEGPEADSSNGASLYGSMDDSVFKKAMFLYTKQKEQSGATNQEGVLNGPESILAPDQEKSGLVDEKLVEEAFEDPVLEEIKEETITKTTTEPTMKDVPVIH
nr:hypothetical protein [Tanacetum cinerariifolium]